MYLFDYVSILNQKVPCVTLDSDFDVTSMIFFILAYGKHYFFILIIAFDHFANFLKYPNHKTIINQHISVPVC